MDSQQLARMQLFSNDNVVPDLPMLARLIMESLEPRLGMQHEHLRLPGTKTIAAAHPIEPHSGHDFATGSSIRLLARAAITGLKKLQASYMSLCAGPDEQTQEPQLLPEEEEQQQAQAAPAQAASAPDTQGRVERVRELQAIMGLLQSSQL